MSSIRPLPVPLNRPVRLAVLISGGGTTLVNLASRIRENRLNAEIGIVISSRFQCAGVQRANELGMRCEVVPRLKFDEIGAFSDAIFALCREARADLIVCGGFLCLVTVPDDYSGRIINTHPSLIPAFCGAGFYGHHVHEAVLARGAKVSGCTIHFVDNIYDHGPIILQRTVPVLDDDNLETLAARVFQAECDALPDAVKLFAAGRLEIEGSRVRTIDPVS